MRLKNIKITTFKRFTNLTIGPLSEKTKLVMLTGPNGSGKTSVFDAFNYWMRFARGKGIFDQEYHTKLLAGVPVDASYLLTNMKLEFHDTNEDVFRNRVLNRKVFYIRSAYRHESDFTVNGINKIQEILDDAKGVARLIDQELRVSDNYQRIAWDSFRRLYDPKHKHRTADDIVNELIGEIRERMSQVFTDLFFEGPGDPSSGGTFRFQKGEAKGFHYKNLSGGEKAAFDLLLDFIIKRRAFNDTIFCIDEPELHMHTQLQSKLLECLFDLIPEKCQLWIATHSIGMAKKAAELYNRDSETVAFLDFHKQDFDKQVVLKPSVPDRIYWKQMFATALDDLSELVMPLNIVFCEGKKLGEGGRKPSFDTAIYSMIFSNAHPETEFVSLGGTNEVNKNKNIIVPFLEKTTPGVHTWSVYDRDDRHDTELAELKERNIRVLLRRDLESYLWDDEILDKISVKNEKSDKAANLKNKKEELLAQNISLGKPQDDIKAISGELYHYCKQELQLTQCGNDFESFARCTLAPLVTPETTVYKELEKIIFGKC